MATFVSALVLLVYLVVESYSIAYCAKFSWDRVYYISCSSGCCGNVYNRYCCMGTSMVAGIVTAVIIGLLVVALAVCVCIKKSNHSGRVVSPSHRPVRANVTLFIAGRSAQHQHGFYGGMEYPGESSYFPKPPPYKPRDPPPPYLNSTSRCQRGSGQGQLVTTSLAPGVHPPPGMPPANEMPPADDMPPAYTPCLPYVPVPHTSAISESRRPRTITIQSNPSRSGQRQQTSSSQREHLETAASEREGLTTAASQRSNLAAGVINTAESQSTTADTALSQREMTTQYRHTETTAS